MTAVPSRAGVVGHRTNTRCSAPTFLAFLCLLAFTACSAPQSTSSTRSYAPDQKWTSSVATESSWLSGESVLAAAESGGDTQGPAWRSDGVATTSPAVVPTTGLIAPARDGQGFDRIQLADSSGSPVIMTAQSTDKASGSRGQGADADLAKLAQKSNNPIGEAWLLITQNDTTLLKGDAIDGEEVLNVTKFQPCLSG